jgi:hypothetical protein
VTSGIEKTCMIDSRTAPELTPWNDTDHSAKNLHLPTPTPSLCCHDSLLFTHELHRHGEEMHRLCLQRIRFPVDSIRQLLMLCAPRAHRILGSRARGGSRRPKRYQPRGTTYAVGPSHWRDCHFADALSPSLLKHLLKVEDGAAE